MEPLMGLDGCEWIPTQAELDMIFITPGVFPLTAPEQDVSTHDMALVGYSALEVA